MFGVLKKIFAFSGQKRGVLVRSMVLSFVGAVFGAMQLLALMLALDVIVGGREAGAIIWVTLGVMLVSIAGRMFCSYQSTNGETEAGYFMVAQKRVHIGDRLRYIPMGYFNRNSLGNITAVVTTTLGDVENSASRCLVIILGGFLNTLALMLMLTCADWRMGVIAIAGIAVYLLVTEASQRHAVRSGPARQRAQETLVEAVLEYIQGMSVVKAFGLERDNHQAVRHAIDDSSQKALGVEHTTVPWLAAQQLVVRVFSVVFIAAALSFYFGGSMELQRCMLMLVASFMVYKELESAGNMSALLQMLDASMDKANEMDETPVMDIDGADVPAKDGSIVFDHVDFSYGDRRILDGVSVAIPAGTTTAIVGPSGGGKTTMCSLIARFWDVQGGAIRVGRRDVRDYKLDSLMRNISMVFQNVYLFQDTIENNIKFGRPDATHEQVVAAARAACCHDFIMALPDGYDTVVGEGGGSLSGGEKQRISIARAMLKDAPIIILDEATASIDPENEAAIQRSISALTKGKTLIVIAHRLSTIEDADNIVVVKDGRVAAQGRQRELLDTCPLYKEMWQAHMRARDCA
ncbi:MAG: ABC transporter ATP-binding protein [Clostridia bacterium]|nr:ABC transporter ATP-binding protein [Clostridia bacterium]